MFFTSAKAQRELGFRARPHAEGPSRRSRLVPERGLSEMIGLALAVLACGAWIYLLAARGGFWRAAQRDDFDVPGSVQPNAQEPGVAIRRCDRPGARRSRRHWPNRAIVVAARTTGGILAVLVVDDQSSDDTAAIARQAAESTGGRGSSRRCGPRLATAGRANCRLCSAVSDTCRLSRRCLNTCC
jgi:hypothetical protein